MTLSLYDRWKTEPPEPAYEWTCGRCGLELQAHTARQMDETECPGCVEAEHDRAKAEEDAADLEATQ